MQTFRNGFSRYMQLYRLSKISTFQTSPSRMRFPCETVYSRDKTGDVFIRSSLTQFFTENNLSNFARKIGGI